MNYRDLSILNWKLATLADQIRQCEEQQCSGIDEAIASAADKITELARGFYALSPDPLLRAKEPDSIEDILNLCPPGGGQVLFDSLPADYDDKLKGAMLSRFAGCTLGAIVEGWTAERIESYAHELGIEHPLTDYWTDTPTPDLVRYFDSPCKDYLRDNLNSVPNDDDVAFVILSLLIAEENGGLDFTLDGVAATWLKYVTLAYTAEDAALRNLKAGISPDHAAEKDNPYQEWIGADIRCDGYAYMAPGNPRLAARLAYTDAYLTHRRNGIYGSMFFAAAISAAFALGDPFKALETALLEIPAECRLAEGIRWALAERFNVHDWKDAVRLTDERYPGMSNVHTLNNACLVVFALHLGGKDIGKCFSNAVAMAHDNDCTAATVGSIAGACYGLGALDKKWYERFNGNVKCFYNGPKMYRIDDLLARYRRLAETSFSRS